MQSPLVKGSTVEYFLLILQERSAAARILLFSSALQEHREKVVNRTNVQYWQRSVKGPPIRYFPEE
jgi:hypothetical protein